MGFAIAGAKSQADRGAIVLVWRIRRDHVGAHLATVDPKNQLVPDTRKQGCLPNQLPQITVRQDQDQAKAVHT